LLQSGSSPNKDDLLSFPRDDGSGLRTWRVGGVPAPDFLLLGSAQWRRPLLPSSHGTLTGEERRENPNGVGGLGTWGFAPLSDLYHGGARGDAKAPSCPRFDPPGGRVGTRLRRAGQASGKRGAGKMGKIPPGLVPTRARAWRFGVRAGRAAVPSSARVRAWPGEHGSAARRKRVRGKRKRWLTGLPHQSARERVKEKGCC
jgi:hypothetical protein